MWRGTTARMAFGALFISAVVGSTGVAFATREDTTAHTVRSTIVGHADHHTSHPASHRSGATQTLVVTVPNIAVLTVDQRGRIVAAATNSGRAPAVGDTVYVVLADGSYQPSAIDLTGRRWKGDFSRSMAFQQQTGDERRTHED